MKKYSKIASKRGFTLVEMMLVVAIIVILAGVAFVSIGSAITKSKSQQDKYSNSYEPAVNDANSSVRGILASTPSARVP